MLLIMTIHFIPEDQLLPPIHKYYRNKWCVVESPVVVQSSHKEESPDILVPLTQDKVKQYIQTIPLKGTL